MVTLRTHLAPRVFSVAALAVTLMTASSVAQASCGGARGVKGAPEVPVLFVGIAMGREPEPAPGGSWPHRFAVEEIESGLEGVDPGDVVEVDPAVNEQFEGGMEVWVEDGFGSAPLVGARYRVGAYASTPPEGGVRYHANGCASGYLQRLDDPEGAEPHAQVLAARETRQVLPAGERTPTSCH